MKSKRFACMDDHLDCWKCFLVIVGKNKHQTKINKSRILISNETTQKQTHKQKSSFVLIPRKHNQERQFALLEVWKRKIKWTAAWSRITSIKFDRRGYVQNQKHWFLAVRENQIEVWQSIKWRWKTYNYRWFVSADSQSYPTHSSMICA